MAEVKEELNALDQEKQEEVVEKVEDTTPEEQEDVDDFFNPFASKGEKEEEVEKVETQEEGEEEKVEVDTTEEYKDEEARSKLEAIDIVDEYLEEHPEFGDVKKKLRDYTARAIMNGHKDPLEFAIRNAKSPEYWIEMGKKRGIEDAQQALKARVGGFSGGTGASGKAPNFEDMSSKDFNDYVNQIVAGQ